MDIIVKATDRNSASMVGVVNLFQATSKYSVA
jgi:hypothetical protein